LKEQKWREIYLIGVRLSIRNVKNRAAPRERLLRLRGVAGDAPMCYHKNI